MVRSTHCRRTDHHLCAIGAEERYLLRTDLVGHREDAAVAAAGGDDGQADAGVARRRFDDGSARPEPPVVLGCRLSPTMVKRGWSLTPPPGLRNSSLASNWPGEVSPDPVEPDERGVADQVQQRVG